MTSGAAVERATLGRGDDPASTVGPSAAALAAQTALEARRAALGIVTRPALDQGQGVEAAASSGRRSTSGAAGPALVGLDGAALQLQDQGQAGASRARPSPAERGQAALEARRLELGINYRRPTVEGRAWSAWAAARAGDDLDGAAVAGVIDPLAGAGGLPLEAAADQGPAGVGIGQGNSGRVEALAGVEATVYPRLAGAILQADKARAARLWLLLLANDPARRGAYDLDQIYETFAGAGSAWRIGGRRCVQQVLKAGRGLFWTFDKRGRLWRRGPARVGAALGLAGGVGAPVEVPVTDLLGGMHSVRARLFAATLSAHDAPIGQGILTELTGACPNSQRAYRRSAGVEARPQYRFLPGAADRAALQEAHWQHGRGVFVFTDYNGQQGQGRGALLLAKRDPNVYAAALGPARRGRTKKINRRLNLVANGARGNGPAVDYERFYFQDAAAAGSAYNRARGRRDVAYRHGQGRGADFWGTLPALEGVGG